MRLESNKGYCRFGTAFAAELEVELLEDCSAMKKKRIWVIEELLVVINSAAASALVPDFNPMARTCIIKEIRAKKMLAAKFASESQPLCGQ